MNVKKKKNFLTPVRVFILLLLINNGHIQAQVGIGTTSPTTSSILDLTSTTKGLLMPRMTAAQKTAIGTPATGLIVYQTDASTGFWYYTGSAWAELKGWGLTGNSGTVDGTNFLGTTDNIPFTIKVNNQKSGRIDHLLSNTFLGYQSGNSNSTGTNNTCMGYMAGFSTTTGARNVFIGDSAGYSNTTNGWSVAVGYCASYSLTTATNTTAIGYRALFANTTGGSNTAVGNAALTANTTGNANTAIGSGALTTNTTGVFNTATGTSALNANTTGQRNIAYGASALQNNTTGNFNSAYGGSCSVSNTTGSYNVAFGGSALNGTTSGNNNTALGYRAGALNTTGSNNIFIGDSSNATTLALSTATAIGFCAKVSTSNSMVLGDTASYPINVGIGTAAPEAKLHIKGDIIFTPNNNSAGTGVLNDYARTGRTNLYFSNAGAKTLNGIDTPVDGMLVYLTNSGGNMTINNNNAGSAAANRIITGSGGALTITGDGGATLMYTGSFWRVVSLVQ